MLYGNVIFIKKTGADGSKFPVTERVVKIGRSEDCLIRIQNPQVALEHCQLIIDDNGQAKLKNISKLTILNGKPLTQSCVTLCHGDIFKLGERLARWEYLPSSKYYQKLLSPTGRLIAVVMPQQRSLDEETAGTVQNLTGLKSTPLSGKRRLSERPVSEGGSAKKKARVSSVTKTVKNVGDVGKLLSRCHSFQTPKISLTAKRKQRKSTSAIFSSKQTVLDIQSSGNFRKSVSLTSPRSKNSVNRKSTPVKKPLPQKLNLKSGGKNAVRISNLKSVPESPPEEISRLTRGLSKSPLKKSSLKLSTSAINLKEKTPVGSPSKLIKSEKKLRFTSSKDFFTGLPRQSKRFSAVLKPSIKTPGKVVLNDMFDSFSKTVSSSKMFPELSENSNIFNSYVLMDSSSAMNSQAQLNLSGTLRTGNSVSKTTTSIGTPKTSSKKRSSIAFETVSLNNQSTPLEKDLTVPKTFSKQLSVSKKSTSKIRTTTPKQLRNNKGRSSYRQVDSEKTSLRKQSVEEHPSRGIRRKLSLSMCSPEKAANKLKTSSPKKPDKNKKAALLVLGKANRKQNFAQNVKVLLKRKIVMKAIKQSKASKAVKNKNTKKVPLKAPKSMGKGTLTKVTVTKRKNLEKKIPSNKNAKARVSKVEISEAESPSGLESDVNVKNSESTVRSKRSPDKNLTIRTDSSKVSSSSPSKFTSSDTSSKSPSKQSKKTVSSILDISKDSFSKMSSDVSSSYERRHNYGFASNRRCSKRLSYKNDLGRPDFMELSPTALGLIPKNAEILKSPREGKRKKLSLSTPKNLFSPGIIKSAKSKTGNLKSVRFSSKDVSINSPYSTSNMTGGTNFDFDSVSTPNITMDIFLSPLSERSQNNISKVNLNETARVLSFDDEDNENIRDKFAKAKSPKNDSRSSKTDLNLQSSLELQKNTRKFSLPAKGNKRSLKSVNSESSINVLTIEGTKRARSIGSSMDLTKSLSTGSPGRRKTPKITKTPLRVRSSKILKTRVSQIKTPKILKAHATPLRKGRGSISSKNRKSFRSSTKLVEVEVPKGVDGNLKDSEKEDGQEATKINKKVLSVKRTRRSLEAVKKEEDVESTFENVKESKSLRGRKSSKSGSLDLRKNKNVSKKPQRSPKNDLSNVDGVRQLMRTPRAQKSPKNDLSNVDGVRQLMKTPRAQKSPKNDLSNVDGVRQLMKTPRAQKSPKNDLSNVDGVRQLMKTPRAQKSPKNDLSNVDGVRQLMKTPRAQKSPKNDLSNVDGVRQLMKTPRVQKSPKNDLSNVDGVRQLMKTPRAQKSPKNDLSNVDGVLQLMKTPRVQKSPKNDLSNVVGVRQLMKTPRVQKSPKDDLSDVDGVRQLFRTPRVQKSPRNSLSDFCGVERLFQSPGTQKLWKNDFSEISEVSKFITTTSRVRRSFRSDLMDIDETDQFYTFPKESSTFKNDAERVEHLFRNEQSLKNDVTDVTGVKQLLISKGIENISKSAGSPRKSGLNDYRNIRGRRTIYSRSGMPKNELTDLRGVKELFSRHKPTNNLDISFTGVAELFDLPTPETHTIKKQKDNKLSKATSAGDMTVKMTTQKVVGRKSINEIEVKVGRRGRPRKVVAEPTKKSTTNNNNSSVKILKVEEKTRGRRGRKPVEKEETLETGAKKVKTRAKVRIEVNDTHTENRSSRKRKNISEDSVPSPPKLRRREKSVVSAPKTARKETIKKNVRKSEIVEPTRETLGNRSSVRTRVKATKTPKSVPPSKVQIKTFKATSKTSESSTSTVQKEGSQRSSNKKKVQSLNNASPRKTRSAQTKTTVQAKKTQTKVQSKTVTSKSLKSTSKKKIVSPVVKRTRRI